MPTKRLINFKPTLATPSPSRLPITTKPPRGATSVCRYPVALSALSPRGGLEVYRSLAGIDGVNEK